MDSGSWEEGCIPSAEQNPSVRGCSSAFVDTVPVCTLKPSEWHKEWNIFCRVIAPPSPKPVLSARKHALSSCEVISSPVPGKLRARWVPRRRQVMPIAELCCPEYTALCIPSAASGSRGSASRCTGLARTVRESGTRDWNSSQWLWEISWSLPEPTGFFFFPPPF